MVEVIHGATLHVEGVARTEVFDVGRGVHVRTTLPTARIREEGSQELTVAENITGISRIGKSYRMTQ